MKGLIFNIQRYSVQDGPGIRTTVFFKGCPLRCEWCSNPESQNAFPEVAHRNSLCNKCSRCVEVCQFGAITVREKGVQIDRARCTNCGNCLEVCGPEALKFLGREVVLHDVLGELRRDEDFYRNSGGGVTASGGESLMQSQFVAHLFRECRNAGLHTCLDTCGYASPKELEAVLEYTNLVLFDLKFLDPLLHQKFTQKSNEPILRNAKDIAKRRIPMIIRIPLIPGINDSNRNLVDIASFVKSIGEDLEVNLLPYHRYGLTKYEMLDRTYPCAKVKPLGEEEIQKRKAFMESLKIRCQVEV